MRNMWGRNMNKQKFKKLCGINRKAINDIELKIDLLKAEIETLKEDRLKGIMQDMTKEQLTKYWNESDLNERYYIIELNQHIESHLQKLADYGGLTYSEILDDILKSDWNESQWINLTEFYADYWDI